MLNCQSIRLTIINFDIDSEFDNWRGNWGWYGAPCINEDAGFDCNLKRESERLTGLYAAETCVDSHANMKSVCAQEIPALKAPVLWRTHFFFSGYCLEITC